MDRKGATRGAPEGPGTQTVVGGPPREIEGRAFAHPPLTFISSWGIEGDSPRRALR